MAVYKLFPSQDASIYSAYPAMNTGLDAILDVSNLVIEINPVAQVCLLYTSPSPRDRQKSRMPSSA